MTIEGQSDTIIPDESGSNYTTTAVAPNYDGASREGSGVNDFLNMDIDDLIPDVYKNVDEKEKPKDQYVETNDIVSDFLGDDTSKNYMEEEESIESIDTKDSIVEEEDIDIDAIEKFLETKDANTTLFSSKQEREEHEKAKEKESQTPWKSDDKYKDLLHTYGIQDPSKLDALLTDLIDSKTITTSKYAQDLETKLEEYEREKSFSTKELSRLKELEKSVLFEHLEETKKEFTQPMSEAIGSIKAITDLEGLPIQNILQAKNKAEFTNAILNTDLDQTALNNLTNHWRNYREIYSRYIDAKAEALDNPGRLLRSSSVDDDTAVEILRDSLFNLIEHDKYSYIKDAISKGYDSDADVSNIIAEAKNEFFGLVKAFNDPLTNARNPKWLSNMAEYVIDAAHARNMESKFYSTKETLANRERQLKELATEYKKLMASARGDFVPGYKRAPTPSNNNGKVKKDKSSLEEYLKILEGKVDVEDILD